MLIQLIYTSTPVGSISEALSDFIPKAKIRNDLDGVTGLIISDSTSYTQVLEGEQSQINALFEDIKKDSRHTDVTLLKYTEITKRSFGRWSMRHYKGHNSIKKKTDIELVDRIFKLTDQKTKPRLLRNILSFLFIAFILGSILGYGDKIEGKLFPPYTGLTANIVAEHPTSVEVLIVANRNRDRNCKVDNLVSSTELEDFLIAGNTKILSMNDPQEERLILKVNIIPKGDIYEIDLRSRCHLFWVTSQTIRLSD